MAFFATNFGPTSPNFIGPDTFSDGLELGPRRRLRDEFVAAFVRAGGSLKIQHQPALGRTSFPAALLCQRQSGYKHAKSPAFG